MVSIVVGKGISFKLSEIPLWWSCCCFGLCQSIGETSNYARGSPSGVPGPAAPAGSQLGRQSSGVSLTCCMGNSRLGPATSPLGEGFDGLLSVNTTLANQSKYDSWHKSSLKQVIARAAGHCWRSVRMYPSPAPLLAPPPQHTHSNFYLDLLLLTHSSSSMC